MPGEFEGCVVTLFVRVKSSRVSITGSLSPKISSWGESVKNTRVAQRNVPCIVALCDDELVKKEGRKAPQLPSPVTERVFSSR